MPWLALTKRLFETDPEGGATDHDAANVRPRPSAGTRRPAGRQLARPQHQRRQRLQDVSGSGRVTPERASAIAEAAAAALPAPAPSAVELEPHFAGASCDKQPGPQVGELNRLIMIGCRDFFPTDIARSQRCSPGIPRVLAYARLDKALECRSLKTSL